MTKQEYLNSPIVREFIEWIGPKLDVGYTHSYIINQRNASWIRYNGRNQNWHCMSIYDAYLQYSWEGSDFITTTNLLNTFETSLRRGLLSNNSRDIDLACYNILKWGGQRVFTPNYPWIQNLNNLSDYFNRNIVLLNPILFNDDIRIVQNNGIDKDK